MEKTFRVKKNSKFYQNYFHSKLERKKFEKLSRIFFNKIGYKGAYTLTRNLMIENYNSTMSQFFPKRII